MSTENMTHAALFLRALATSQEIVMNPHNAPDAERLREIADLFEHLATSRDEALVEVVRLSDGIEALADAYKDTPLAGHLWHFLTNWPLTNCSVCALIKAEEDVHG